MTGLQYGKSARPLTLGRRILTTHPRSRQTVEFLRFLLGRTLQWSNVPCLNTCSATNIGASSIVAVHGLNGDAYNTWTTDKSKVFWLGDGSLLPGAIKNARILTFGYNANVTSLLGSTSSNRILQHAQTLVAQLEADRAALAYSASRIAKNIAHIHSIYVSTYAIIFLGTPHNGSSKANLARIGQRMIKALVPPRVLDTEGQLLDALQEDSETLQNITDQFTPLMKQFHIYFFWEQEKTDMGTTKGCVNLPIQFQSIR
ncbi:hypothetical protein FGG08_005840 [Glutinoglossum americanum]|uniref:Uncharacterized protein n=1 Tax=Glutinoglossum americanum TaxID=1670608 RepID=A0A9P8KY44_9PEZI|nr:hypothetical protein FGG08_005840 [Glutinoglossum americanum]